MSKLNELKLGLNAFLNQSLLSSDEIGYTTYVLKLINVAESAKEYLDAHETCVVETCYRCCEELTHASILQSCIDDLEEQGDD